MLPTLLAYPLAVLPFVSLLGTLTWMARSTERPAQSALADEPGMVV
jgi:hypothetical protein